ncbi:flagellar protein FlgN [Lentibacter algarum]|uniref:flagellar protein FlgN n=1 Tax=Lentibacter algarum TaxID=576131 RepID=UPI001C07A3F3|nr:flagellar protein FlgN [Lentibacter algarum]MBU2981212.1 flagellar protein FlgN [Lentibacter algarum]
MTPLKVISELDRLLEKERAALFDGELEKLAGLVERKKELIDALNSFGMTDTDELLTLQGKAARNQALLDSALRGIKSVSKRLAALQKVRKSLQTYDANGQKKTIESTQPGKLEKRA